MIDISGFCKKHKIFWSGRCPDCKTPVQRSMQLPRYRSGTLKRNRQYHPKDITRLEAEKSA